MMHHEDDLRRLAQLAGFAGLGGRAQYPRGDECKEAIEQLGTAMTVLAGWLQTMSDDDLTHLEEALRKSLRIVEEERKRRDGR